MGKMGNVRGALEVCRTARTILGGNGITLEYPVIRHMNNLESVLTYEGTHEVHTLSWSAPSPATTPSASSTGALRPASPPHAGDDRDRREHEQRAERPQDLIAVVASRCALEEVDQQPRRPAGRR